MVGETGRGEAVLPRYWQDLAWTDFAALPQDTVAVLPVAAIEQHGPHLPLSVDATINEGIVGRALALLPAGFPVLVLPMQAIGLSIEHVRFPGTLTAPMETLAASWTAIGRCVAAAGLRRLVVLNSHGGQPQLVNIVCRRLRVEAEMFAVSCLWTHLGLPADPALTADELQYGIHGGLIETAMMLALRPDLVRMDKAADFRSAWSGMAVEFTTLAPEGGAGFGWQTQDLNGAGALGNAAAATPALGERLLDHTARRVATLLNEVRRFDVEAWLQDRPDPG